MTKTLSLIITSAFCTEVDAPPFLINLNLYDHLLAHIFVVDYVSSFEFLHLISTHPRVTILTQATSTGIYGAWQLGLSQITSTHVCFAGIDDCLNPLFISAFLSSDCEAPFLTIYYGDKVLVKNHKNILVRSPIISSLVSSFLVSCDVPIPGLIFPKFPPNYIDVRFQLAADMNLLLLLLRHQSVDLCYLNLVQVNQEFDGISNSPKSLSIYLHEWRLIEVFYPVKINYFNKLSFYFMLLIHRCRLFNFFRRIKQYVFF